MGIPLFTIAQRQKVGEMIMRRCTWIYLYTLQLLWRNIEVKEVGREVGIKKLQFYAARHSVATIAANAVEIPIYIVNNMLCHTDAKMRITELYIKKDFKSINEANIKVLDYVFLENHPRQY